MCGLVCGVVAITVIAIIWIICWDRGLSDD